MRTKGIETAFLESDTAVFGKRLLDRYPTARFTLYMHGSYGGPDISPEITYFQNLEDTSERLWVWLEPEDWQPRFELKHIQFAGKPQSIWILANQPTLSFVFETGSIPERYRYDLRPGFTWARYEDGDKQHLRFLNAVWRMIDRVSSRWIMAMSDDGRRIFDPIKSGFRVGPSAAQWLGESPERRLNSHFRLAPQCYEELGIPIPDDPAFAGLPSQKQ